MISQPPYVWSHIQYTCDILSMIFMTSYPLCMKTQHCVWLIPHLAYVWQHLHYRWYHIHSITPNHSIFFLFFFFYLWWILSYIEMKQPRVYTMSHPLQAWHHTDCIRHRTHCIFIITKSPLISYSLLYNTITTKCVTSYALYITSYQLLMSSHYCTYPITASIYETTSSM